MPASDVQLQQQRIAFGYLLRRTRAAHLEGDGVLVNHLCATALDQLDQHFKKDIQFLSLREIAWILIFPQFWLIDDYLLNAAKEGIDRLQPANESECELLEILRTYNALIVDPFREVDLAKPAIADAKLEWVSFDYRIEDELLLTHLLELAWYRKAEGTHWKTIAEKWQTRAPAWLKIVISQTEQRLRAQTGLAILGAESIETKSPLPNETAWLAQLWEAAFDCRWAEIDSILADQVPRHGLESPYSRLLFDFRHFNRWHGVWGDDQAIGLTRRLLTITSFPKLTFDELRASRRTDIYVEIVRLGKSASDSQITHGHRLAMLCEIETLRAWDMLEWKEAIKMQSHLLLETAEKHPKRFALLGFGAVQLAVQSLSYDKKTPKLRKMILALDFAPIATRRDFFKRLLAARDIYAHSLLLVFADFSDSLPEESLEGIAEWSIKYLKLSKDKELIGSKSVPLEFWRNVLPFVPKKHSLWETLLEAVVHDSTVSNIKQMDDGWIGAYLRHAPHEKAKKVIEAMITASSADQGDRNCAWEIVCSILNYRSDLNEFSGWAATSAPTSSDLLRIKNSSRIGEDPEAETKARENIREKLSTFIAQSKKTNGPRSAHPHYPGATPIVVPWREKDEDVFKRLIEAIDNIETWNEYVPLLLLFVKQIASKGPIDFTYILSDKLQRWIDTSPGTIEANYNATPWSTSPEEITSEVSEKLLLMLECVWRRDRLKADGFVRQSVKRFLSNINLAAAPALAMLQLHLAYKSESLERAELVGSTRVLLAFAWGSKEDEERYQIVAEIVGEIRVFIQHELKVEGLQTESSNGDFVRQVIEGLEVLLVEFSRAPHPNLRASVAQLLRELEGKNELSPQLKLILENLRNDVRMRVRHAAF